jgi:hypothetical protein
MYTLYKCALTLMCIVAMIPIVHVTSELPLPSGLSLHKRHMQLKCESFWDDIESILKALVEETAPIALH